MLSRNLEIDIPASTWHWHRQWHRPWHRHCKSFIFSLRLLFWKNEIFMLFLMLSSLVSVFLFYKYLLLKYCIFIHPHAPIVALGKNAVWGFKSTCPLVFRKNNYTENFWKLLNKTSMMRSFLSTFTGLPGSFPKR